jgi:hypothetical protein
MAGEQERLEATLTQGESEPVQVFFDSVESIRFILDLKLPEDFRRTSKAHYNIVHNRQVRGAFIAGLKPETRKQVCQICQGDKAQKKATGYYSGQTGRGVQQCGGGLNRGGGGFQPNCGRGKRNFRIAGA